MNPTAVQQMNSQPLSLECPTCNSNSIYPIMDRFFVDSSCINKIGAIYRWYHYIYQCSCCGHIFNAECPSSASLKDYYQSTLDHKFEDYDCRKRIQFIEQNYDCSKLNLELIDYGSNKPLAFHTKYLKSLGFEVACHDIADTSKASLDSIQCIAKADVITSYFCLEHLPREGLINFFTFAANSLKPNGLLVVEVPCATEYFADYSGLLHEHLQHFTPYSLSLIASFYDFYPTEISYINCSRSFGFAAAFKLIQSSVKPLPVNSPRHKTLKESFISGKKRFDSQEAYAARVAEDLSLLDDAQIIIWGVNDNYIRLSRYLKFPVTAIDMDNTKKSWVFEKDTFIQAEDFIKTMKGSDYSNYHFVITASSHIDSITGMIKPFTFSGNLSISIVPYTPNQV